MLAQTDVLKNTIWHQTLAERNPTSLGCGNCVLTQRYVSTPWRRSIRQRAGSDENDTGAAARRNRGQRRAWLRGGIANRRQLVFTLMLPLMASAVG